MMRNFYFSDVRRMERSERLSKLMDRLGEIFAMVLLAAIILLPMFMSAEAKAFGWGESTRPGNLNGSSYARGEALQGGSVLEGRVLYTRQVYIESTATAQTVGGVTGGALGVMAGSQIGKGNGKLVAQVLGGLAGAAVGTEVGGAMGSRKAWEIVVKAEDGRKIVVTQASDDGQFFRPGDAVLLMKSNGGNIRVVALNQPAYPAEAPRPETNSWSSGSEF